MIILTGGLGFIGSAFLNYLNENSSEPVIVIDTFGNGTKWKNVQYCNNIVDVIHPDDPAATDIEALIQYTKTKAFVHLGAITSTTETNVDKLWKNNVVLPRKITKACIKNGARLVYASSAATYGATDDFDPSPRRLNELQPLNAYGWSKHQFDLWAQRHKAFSEEANVAALKLFNVYGCNETHKGSQQSLISKIAHDYLVNKNDMVNLFHNEDAGIEHGEEKRDHVYVKDVCKVLMWLLDAGTNASGVFNVGTGEERSWNNVVSAIETATGNPIKKNFVDMPENIKDTYQYYTKADLTSLREAGYKEDFMSLEAGVKDYIQNHWTKTNKGYWL